MSLATTTTLQNTFVRIAYDAQEKSIVIYDEVDKYNEPAVMSRSKRGIAKAFATLQANFTLELKFSKAWDILQESGIRTHHWCRMD